MTAHHIKQLIDDEISRCQHDIHHHRGVGPYHDLCQVWQIQLGVYIKVRDLIDSCIARADASNPARSRQPIDLNELLATTMAE